MCRKVQNTRAQLLFSLFWEALNVICGGSQFNSPPFACYATHTIQATKDQHSNWNWKIWENNHFWSRKLAAELFAIPEIIIGIGGCLTVWLALSAKKVQIWVGSVGDQIVFIVRPNFYFLLLTNLRSVGDQIVFIVRPTFYFFTNNLPFQQLSVGAR